MKRLKSRILNRWASTFGHGRNPNDEILMAIGALQCNLLKQRKISSFRDAEFQVFSQWGEDGLIQYLVDRVDIPNEIFVEFGVQSYEEANTRFLLTNNNWTGLIIDGGTEHLQFLKSSGLAWRYDIRSISAFITKDNINQLIENANIKGDIGILSVDIDGVDYWVLEAIDVVQPRILIVEYNGLFGAEAAVSVPYQADFIRSNAHYSNLYYGASLAAFDYLAEQKGYSLIGCNTAGNNAFFVRNDCLPVELQVQTAASAFETRKFWECRQPNGELDSNRDIQRMITKLANHELVDVRRNEKLLTKDVF